MTIDVAMLTEVRAREPERVAATWAARRRRGVVEDDGRLLIIAADHPARGSLGVGDDPTAMYSRSDLLERLVVSLSRPGVDGVLGSADVLDDLALLGALDDKVVIGSMNRGGLLGARFELDDRFTGYTADQIEARGLEGGKMLVRMADEDPGSVSTLESAGHAVTALADRRLMAMVEPFVSRWEGGSVRNLLDTDSVIRSVAVASGLGSSSAYTWLKLPVVDEIERVMDSTTLPTLLLGGDPKGPADEAYAAWRAALDLPAVRGLVVGRALLYPQDGDVAGAVDIAASLVHAAPGGRR